MSLGLSTPPRPTQVASPGILRPSIFPDYCLGWLVAMLPQTAALLLSQVIGLILLILKNMKM